MEVHLNSLDFVSGTIYYSSVIFHFRVFSSFSFLPFVVLYSISTPSTLVIGIKAFCTSNQRCLKTIPPWPDPHSRIKLYEQERNPATYMYLNSTQEGHTVLYEEVLITYLGGEVIIAIYAIKLDIKSIVCSIRTPVPVCAPPRHACMITGGSTANHEQALFVLFLVCIGANLLKMTKG